LLDWVKQAGREPGIIGFYRTMADERRRRQAPPDLAVRLRPPAGIAAVQLLSGAHRSVAPDGTAAMPPADAEPLLRAGWTPVEEGEPAEPPGAKPAATRRPPAARQGAESRAGGEWSAAARERPFDVVRSGAQLTERSN
jgi:hypothetical protein